MGASRRRCPCRELSASSPRQRWRSRPTAPRRLIKGVPLATGAPCESVGGVYALASTSRPAGGAFGPDHPLTPATRPGAHAAAAHAGARVVLGWEQPRRSAIEEREPGGCNFVGSKPFGADGAPGVDPDRGERVRLAGRRSLAHARGRTKRDGGARVDRGQRAGASGSGGWRQPRRDRYPDIVAPRLRRAAPPAQERPARRPAAVELPSERASARDRADRQARPPRARSAHCEGAAPRACSCARPPASAFTSSRSARDRAGNPSSPLVLEAFRVR